jgi:hypothetical protein
MPENKTKPTQASAEAFIEEVEHPGKREDARVLDALFRRVTGERPVMWGPSIIGYGSYHYKYSSGHEGNMCRSGFSPRKAKHSLYLLGCGGKDAEMEALLARLGKYSRGRACLYINRLSDVDLDVLEAMIRLSWDGMNRLHPE